MHELWKWLLWKLGLRRFTPPPFGKVPMFSQTVPDIGDTGGGGWYRPPYRMQDPAKDPQEPYGSESSGAGNDHGWSNCTMAAGAMAMGFATNGEKAKWGGDMRHHQSDQSGGTDLNDLDQAFAAYSETFIIKSGTGWDDVQKYRKEGRAIVIQGQGNVPGSESFDGGHACVILPETQSDASKWLFGDPLATGWQWVSESSIKSWAQAWNSSISFGITDPNKPPPPDQPPPSNPPGTPAGPPEKEWCNCEQEVEAAVQRSQDASVNEWYEWLREPQQGDPPQPVADAIAAIQNGVGLWGSGRWRQFIYEPPPPPPANAARWDESMWTIVDAAWV